MTEKQEKIIKAGLRLFANEGFAATSTSKVAKAAGVSEGLIFRHFKNKEGLLDAIMNMSQEASNKHFAEVLLSNSPQEIIGKMLEIPFKINPSEYEMWRLTYALKWQMDRYDSSKLSSIKLVIKDAFSKLEYSDPEAETEILFMVIDGAATSFLLHEPANKQKILTSLKAKYQL